MKRLSILIVLIFIIGVILYLWPQKQTTSPTLGNQHWTIDFQFSESEINSTSFASPQPLNLAAITKLLSQRENWEYQFDDYGDLGIIVTQIKDKKNGEDQKYWQYFVDNEQPQVSVDKYFPANNAHIIWKFIKSEL